MKRILFLFSLLLLGIAAHGQNPPDGNVTVKPPTQAADQTPPPDADASTIVANAYNSYATAKSYQGTWSYTIERGSKKQKLVVDVKMKGSTRLFFHVLPPSGVKPSDPDFIPELLILVDGTSAYSINISDNTYYKVDLPKDAKISPITFFPQIPSVSGVHRTPNIKVDGKDVIVLEANNPDGGLTQMNIDATTFHVRKISKKMVVAFGNVAIPVNSTISMDKETFGGDLADSVFTFKAPKDSKEIPAPPEATALFGIANNTPKQDKK